MFNPVQRAFERIGICQQLSFGYVGVVVAQITRLPKSKLALLRGVLLGGSNLEMVSSTDLSVCSTLPECNSNRLINSSHSSILLVKCK